MKHIEAMQLALDALESCGAGHISDGGNQWHDEKLVDKAIKALREALANEALDRMAENARDLGLDYEAEQPAPVQQVPVGTYGEIYQAIRELLQSGKVADQQIYLAMKDKPLYTSPPAQRTWVGLTEGERKKIEKRHIFVEDAIRLTEAKLKEKNT